MKIENKPGKHHDDVVPTWNLKDMHFWLSISKSVVALDQK